MKIKKVHNDLLPLPDCINIDFDWSNNDNLKNLIILKNKYSRVKMTAKVNYIINEYKVLATSIVLNKFGFKLFEFKLPLESDNYYYRIYEYNKDGTINNEYDGCNVLINKLKYFTGIIPHSILDILPNNFAKDNCYIYSYRDNKINDGNYIFRIVMRLIDNYFVSLYDWRHDNRKNNNYSCCINENFIRHLCHVLNQ